MCNLDRFEAQQKVCNFDEDQAITTSRMELHNQDVHQVPPRAPPLLVTQEPSKKISRTPRRPFTDAREYKKLFKKRKLQVFNVKESQKIQEVVDQNFECRLGSM